MQDTDPRLTAIGVSKDLIEELKSFKLEYLRFSLDKDPNPKNRLILPSLQVREIYDRWLILGYCLGFKKRSDIFFKDDVRLKIYWGKKL